MTDNSTVPYCARSSLKEVKMCASCSQRIKLLWSQLKQNQQYKTPDRIRGVCFSLASVRPGYISISPQNIKIKRVSFSDALHYLTAKRHYQMKPCPIASNNKPNLAGKLCKAARQRNYSKRRCINYILPIFHMNRIVNICGRRPNKTWLI